MVTYGIFVPYGRLILGGFGTAEEAITEIRLYPPEGEGMDYAWGVVCDRCDGEGCGPCEGYGGWPEKPGD